MHHNETRSTSRGEDPGIGLTSDPNEIQGAAEKEEIRGGREPI